MFDMSCRRAFGLPPVEAFSDITPDEEVAATLKQLYGNVDNIDPYVGGLAEPAEGAAHFGPLFAASITEQFLVRVTRLRPHHIDAVTGSIVYILIVCAI